ncbi:MAG: polysaccharide biosynthesis/export family protein [Phycisphaerales bacterium]|nr:MAG: polysaccharide biosynthesis/export family protein [Phycisphaerales bacterium]
MISCPRRHLHSAALLLACAGCAPKNADMLHFLREHRHQVSAIEYRVGIPDVVMISAPRILEIDGESQRIQPDGKINLRLLGEVKVVDMTAKEISAKLEVLLSRFYVDPKVSVRVGYASKKYYVCGQTRSGARAYTGRDTLLDAVVNSGVDYTSWTSRVKVIRPSHGETPVRTLVIDVDEMIKNGDWSQNILLEPDDIVYVPPTPLAWLGQRIREVLDPFGPIVRAYSTPAYLLNMEEVYERDADGRYKATGAGYGGY